MTPTIFIGDLHGNITFFENVLKKFPEYKYIFLGDILDSRVYSKKDCVDILLKILSLIEEEKAECLIGNHEAGYLYGEELLASGNNPTTYAMIMPEFSRMNKLLKRCLWFEDEKILVTHAGLSSLLKISVEDLLGYKEMNILNTPYAYIGRDRGGENYVGGPLWCDEKEFRPISGITQIFGHTPGKAIREVRPGNWNIDISEHVPEKQVLKYEDGIFSIEPV